MIEEKSGVSFKMLISICGVFLIPCMGVIFTVLIFAIRDSDTLVVIKDTQKIQQVQLDTLKERQERYNYQYKSRFDKLERKK